MLLLSESWGCVWLLLGTIICWTDESITHGGVYGLCINQWRPYDARNDIISWDHGLLHDHHRALFLSNPGKSSIGPLETKPKEKKTIFKRVSELKISSTK